MIQVDLTHMRRFIALPYEAALAPRLRIAHNHLQKNDGAGGDFTGWVRLPQEYDRQEFDRIQAAARRIQSDSRALVVIGIGGSYLGARGVIECLCSPNYNLRRKDTPNIYFVGNGLSDRQLRETMELLEGVDFSVNVIPSPAPPRSLPWPSGSSGSCWRRNTAPTARPGAFTPPPTGRRGP